MSLFPFSFPTNPGGGLKPQLFPSGGGYKPQGDPFPIISEGTTPVASANGPSPFGPINYTPTTIYEMMGSGGTGTSGGGDSTIYIIIGLIALAGVALFMIFR